MPEEQPAAPDRVGEDAADGAAAESNDQPVPETAVPDPEAPASDTAPGEGEGTDAV